MKITNFIAVLLLIFLGCTKKSTPEFALQEFISYRFEGNQSKDDIVEMTTGKIYDQIAALEGKELEDFLDTKDLRKKKVKVLRKSCEAEKCFLTYIIGYSQGKEEPHDFAVEVKKIAELVQVGEIWKLADISNVKTYIEGRKNLDVSNQE